MSLATLNPADYLVPGGWEPGPGYRPDGPEAYQPNGPFGSWIGLNPVHPKSGWPFNPVPTSGAVVYFLFDYIDRLCYIGSTKYARNRIRQHANCRLFLSWQAFAHPSGNRQIAREVEMYLIRGFRPYDNVAGLA